MDKVHIEMETGSSPGLCFYVCTSLKLASTVYPVCTSGEIGTSILGYVNARNWFLSNSVKQNKSVYLLDLIKDFVGLDQRFSRQYIITGESYIITLESHWWAWGILIWFNLSLNEFPNRKVISNITACNKSVCILLIIF